MSPEILTILPNLSIGVVSVLALVYVVHRFLQAMDERTKRHEVAMKEREVAHRELEKEVRETIFVHLAEARHAVQENGRMMDRVMSKLDKI